MDLTPIPKTFWHALSAAILVVSIGLIVIAYRSQSVTIEFANTKIALSTLATRTENTLIQAEQVAASLAAEERRLQESRDVLTKSIGAGRPKLKLENEKVIAAEIKKLGDGTVEQMKVQGLQQRVIELKGDAKAVSKAVGELSVTPQTKKSE